MAAYRGSNGSTGNNPTSGSWDLTGTNWQPGDVAVFWWYTNTDTKTVTEPGTVTQKYDTSSAGFGRIFIGYRVLQSGDTTFGWTSSSVTNATTIWGVDVFSGIDANNADPFEAASGTPATFTNTVSPNPPAVVTVGPNAMVVTIFGKNNDFTSVTAPSTYSLGDTGSDTAGSDASAGLAYKEVPTAGTTEDPGAWTLGGGTVNDDGYVWTGALRSAKYSAAQAQTQILAQAVTRNVFGQTNAAIKTIENEVAQANAHIKIVELESFAQANAFIEIEQHEQAQAAASIKATNNASAQARALIVIVAYSSGNTLGITGDTSDIYVYIDESSISDSDYIVSPAGSFGYYETQLQGHGTPQYASQHIVKFRGAKFGASLTLDVALYSGTTLVATRTFSLTDSFTDYEYTLTSAEIATITSYTDLRLRFTRNTAGTVVTRALISWAALSVPPAMEATRRAYGQAQAFIDRGTKSAFAQAQAFLIIKGNAHAQAEAYIIYLQSAFAQAQAQVFSAVTTASVHGQAQGQIRPFQHATVIADLENDGWVGTSVGGG